jgi:hypothetical protein
MRYSPSFQRDWKFYLDSRDVFTFCGKHDSEILEKILSDPNGLTAKECFLFLDGRGEIKPCSEPDLLFQVLKVKAAINWQVKQWAEMLLGGVLMPSELVECRDDYNLPSWVLESVLNQSRKMGWPEPWIQYTKNLLTTTPQRVITKT